MPLRAPLASGNGRCEEPSLFGAYGNESEACVAGCCIAEEKHAERRCRCRSDKGLQRRVRGARCNLELQCTLVSASSKPLGLPRHADVNGEVAADVALASESVCAVNSATSFERLQGDDVEVCTCKRMGAVAVFSHLIAPSTTLSALLEDRGRFGEQLEVTHPPNKVDLTGLTSGCASHRSPSYSACQAFALDASHLRRIGFLLAVATAAAALTLRAFMMDRAELWCSSRPKWLLAPEQGWTFHSLFFHNLRLYHAVVRVCSVVPGHTSLTRVQSFQLLFLQLQLTAVGIVLYLGAQQW